MGFRLTATYLLGLVFTGFLVSCAGPNMVPYLSGNTAQGREKPGDFIELKDGTIVEGTVKQKYKGSWKATVANSGSMEVDGEIYPSTKIVAIQKDGIYHRRFNTRTFPPRIVKGKINIYKETHEAGAYFGTSSTMNSPGHESYYIQKGSAGKLEYWDPAVLKKMIADDSDAIAEYEKYKALDSKGKRQLGDQYLDRVIAVYNK